MKQKLLLMTLAMLCSLVAWSADGDTFTAETIEGVEMTFVVTDEDNALVQVGKGVNSSQCISRETIGGITIPQYVSFQSKDYIVASIADYAFQNCWYITSVFIPSSIKTIGKFAFQYCDGYRGTKEGLSTVTISDGVEKIDDYAFAACYQLKSITIPKSVSFIGCCILGACRDLESIQVDDENSYYDSRNNCNAIVEKETNSLICGCKKTIIPQSISQLADEAFEQCYGLTTIEIPSNIKSIGHHCFYGCTDLKSVISYITQPFSFGSSAFSDIGRDNTNYTFNNAALFVPYGTRDAYIDAGWTEDVFKLGIYEMKDDLSISANEIGTYSSTNNLDFTDISGLRAYIASGFSPSTGELLLTRVYKVPAGEGVLLKGEAGEYEVPYGETDMVYSNLLRGVTAATTIAPTDGDYTNFILADGTHGIGFYTLSQAGEIAAGKAYLQLPTSALSVAESRGVKLRFDDENGMTTAIEEAGNGEDGHQEYFDMQGRRVPEESLKSGLYIVRATNGNGNGKKIFIR